ncbi:MAG: ssDNA-binding protein [Pseudomonadota bacterium]
MSEILIQNVRLAYGHGVFEKQSFEDGKPKFTAKFILPPDHPQIPAIKSLIAQVAKDKWAAKADATLKRIEAKDATCLHDGDTQRGDGFEGMLFVTASNDKRPTAYNRDRTPVTKEDGVIYSGCYVNVKVDIWAQDNSWGQRINGDLLGVQFVKDGDSFAAGAPPAEAEAFPDLDAGGAAEADSLYA